MDLTLIDLSLFAISMSDLAANIWMTAAVVFGLGMVIFVHELGHFAVAKWCGVKCEKFYLGFGRTLVSFKWGETEYGIGILPLGGYVKMLGQDDNPAQQTQEIERSRQAREGQTGSSSEADSEARAAELRAAEARAAEAPAQVDYVLDPRSYLAKSVPQRMAIISAGVIMNMIFAFLVYVYVYSTGIEVIPATASYVIPGQPAWAAGMQTGDQVVQIGDRKAFDWTDIPEAVALGDYDHETGLVFKIRRPDADAKSGYRDLELTMKPDRKGILPMIGMAPQFDAKLSAGMPTFKYSPAAEVKTLTFNPGDRVVAVGDQRVEDYTEIQQALTHADWSKWVNIKVSRESEDGSSKEISIAVAPRAMKTLGLEMEMGKISAVRVGSPAESAGLSIGDVVTRFNGEPVGDPFTLPQRMLALVGQDVSLTVQNGSNVREVKVKPVDDRGQLAAGLVKGDDVVVVSALGLTYRVMNRIARVTPDSPAAEAEKLAGKTLAGEVVQAELLFPKDDADESKKLVRNAVMKFEKPDAPNQGPHWPFLMGLVQLMSPETRVKLTMKNGDEFTVAPAASTEYFLADRGLHFGEMKELRQAEGFGEACSQAAEETVYTMGIIFRFLKKLVTRELSPELMGGPPKIAVAAWRSVEQGLNEFLMFLAALSVNLAVINSLPIPVLDGGHFAFLAYEGLRGKPASDRVIMALHMAGLSLILCLVVFVFVLDGTWIWNTFN